MQHFAHLEPAARQRLFQRVPEVVSRDSDRELRAVALGATLYSPADRPALAGDIAKLAAQGVCSHVLCLEDAVADDQLEAAEANLVVQLRRYAEAGGGDSQLFVRVRMPDQIPALLTRLGPAAEVLSGFVLPKFTAPVGRKYLDTLTAIRGPIAEKLLVMPVIESPEVVHQETRTEVLHDIARLLQAHRERVLAVRVGATDLCGVLGLRRDRELSIYDLHPIAGVLADIVGMLGRADGTGFVVTGPVWEYFSGHPRLFKPLLRTTPFAEQEVLRLRSDLLAHDLDGLIREIVLDKANGMTGKTVIHPSHVHAVHALLAVTAEEYADAKDILDPAAAQGGVRRSHYNNKMNEVKPHRAWAHRTLLRSRVFGVTRAGVSMVDLLDLGAA
ncbi:MAG: HpcH/HpaI aldolase/citrate lyase family protein [Geodermatophilaceae bacterium]|nr:HpcH/HpaI aldolase/citrate lyase family protein [Geodermatophilaceae bacterium]MDQ3454254.1 HpcH/HpaI aldolase/citrate lyase family protein [Actinomycetota bacterium]